MRKCPVCKKGFEGNAKKKYCSHRCKKAFENTKSKAPISKPAKVTQKDTTVAPAPLNRPTGLNAVAAAYWDKIAPTVISRGHLNVLSEDAFAELCDLHSRITDINTMINLGTVQKCDGCGHEIVIPGNRSLLQVDDKWSANDNSETRTFKESALSDLKRKYSRQFLDYCKQFYLTPASNRGNFGLPEKDEKEKDEFFD
jgi:phage terminase small subunit